MNSSNPPRRETYTREELFAQVQGEAARILKVPPGELRPEARWVDDLEADSLDLTELATAVETRFGIRVEDADLVLPTVRDSCELIWRLVSEHQEGRSEAVNKISAAMAGSTANGPSPGR